MHLHHVYFLAASLCLEGRSFCFPNQSRRSCSEHCLAGASNLFCSSDIRARMYYNISCISCSFLYVGHWLSVVSLTPCLHGALISRGVGTVCLPARLLSVQKCCREKCSFWRCALMSPLKSRKGSREEYNILGECLLPFECWGPRTQSTRRRLSGSVVSLPISVTICLFAEKWLTAHVRHKHPFITQLVSP